MPYGALARLPGAVGRRARRRAGAARCGCPGIPRRGRDLPPAAVPAGARAARPAPGRELWYWRWDRYEVAYDARRGLRERLEQLHELARERSALTFVVSDALAELEREAGREACSSRSPPTRSRRPTRGATVVAVSLGHLGRRTDWTLLRAVAERMPELVLLLVGEWHEDECGGDPDFQACRAAPNLVWLGRRSDEEAARLIACAPTSGIVPFERASSTTPACRTGSSSTRGSGRRTVAPDARRASARGSARCTVADAPEEWVAALRAQAGVRTRPDLELREWALAQTARAQNQPLWERLEALGIDGRPGPSAHAAPIRAAAAPCRAMRRDSPGPAR